jgi:protocatechuate 3,4-dioxygenase beta subunit
VKMNGRDKWTTQCYVKGEPQNAHDSVLKEIRDPRAREAVIVDFGPIPGSSTSELAARFDIVLG